MSSDRWPSKFLFIIIIYCWYPLLSKNSLKKQILGCIFIVLFLPVHILGLPSLGLKLLKACCTVISLGFISLFTQETLLRLFKDYVGSSLSSYPVAILELIFMVKEYSLELHMSVSNKLSLKIWWKLKISKLNKLHLIMLSKSISCKQRN